MTAAIKRYQQFLLMVENTPDHMRYVPHNVQRMTHAAIGLSTEAAEILDVFKKHLYGKEKPLDEAAFVNLREECGDMFYYLMLMLHALGYSFEDMLEENTAKLAKRYAINVTD